MLHNIYHHYDYDQPHRNSINLAKFPQIVRGTDFTRLLLKPALADNVSVVKVAPYTS